MKVIKIEHVERIVPNCGSGTGYSQYVKFGVHFDNNTYQEVIVSDWYNNDQWQQFESELTMLDIDNWNEVYDMFMTALRNR